MEISAAAPPPTPLRHGRHFDETRNGHSDDRADHHGHDGQGQIGQVVLEIGFGIEEGCGHRHDGGHGCQKVPVTCLLG